MSTPRDAAEAAAADAGTLYLIATPIGHLEDLSGRAARLLGEVACIACEDTRRARVLLSSLGISAPPLVSYHEHNEEGRTPGLISRLQQGASIALISDAGTPCIADPGYTLVNACVEQGLRVVPVPGPCAAVAALSASGLPVHAWSFRGFAPRDPRKRRALLDTLEGSPETAIIYESPRRTIALLEELRERLGATRRVCVAREVTKRHEEFIRGTCDAVLETLRARDAVLGEIVVIIEGADPRARSPEEDARAEALLSSLAEAGSSARTIRDALVAAFDLPRKEAYRRALAATQGA